MKAEWCIGCQWRTPKKLGGQGFMCLEEDGECPRWVIIWTAYILRRAVNQITDEEMLEANRL